jgi:hypothetical protein
MSEEAVQSVATKVDLDSIDSSLVEESIVLNPDANPMEAPPPVDDGTWRIKLTGADDWTNKDTKPNKNGESTSYLATQFSGIVIAEGTKNNNKRVFGRVNTLVFDGKSEMAYILLQIYGGKASAEARAKVEALKNYVDLAKAFRAAVAGEPIIRVSTKWVARYNAGTKEAPDYKVALSGQSNFPSDNAGGRVPVVQVRGVGDVRAQAEIQDYFPA